MLAEVGIDLGHHLLRTWGLYLPRSFFDISYIGQDFNPLEDSGGYRNDDLIPSVMVRPNVCYGLNRNLSGDKLNFS